MFIQYKLQLNTSNPLSPIPTNDFNVIYTRHNIHTYSPHGYTQLLLKSVLFQTDIRQFFQITILASSRVISGCVQAIGSMIS